MRARLLLTGTAIALTLCACSRTQAATTPGSVAAPDASAPAATTTLTFDRHFRPRPSGLTMRVATGERRSGERHTHGSWSDDDTADQVDGTDPSVADDEWTDETGADDRWADDDGTIDAATDDGGIDDTDGEWTDDSDGEWTDGEWTDDEWADDEWADDSGTIDDEVTDDSTSGYDDETGADDQSGYDDQSAADDESGYDDETGADDGADGGPAVDGESSPELDTTLADLRAAWSTAVAGTTATVIVVPSGQRVATACDDGSATYATPDDAFYCDADDTIVIGADVMSEIQSEFGAGGIAFLLAHEYGHNLQVETGADAPDSATAKPTELHADCLAGAYLADAQRRGAIVAAALDQARAAAYAVGDDAVNDPDHHGTSQERLAALNAGISGADCKAYLG